MRSAAKKAVKWICLVLMFPAAALTGFGRLEAVYTFFAHACAMIPGIIGDYIRCAYYTMVLRSCSNDCLIGFGSYFSQSKAIIAKGVGVGAYCVIGRANIGEHTLLGSCVQILSGQHQHSRGSDGRLREGQMIEIRIGANCWIGASAIVMADVGDGATIAAGAIVSLPVPAGATVAGNPARFVKAASSADS